jgi:hypothetical protein
MASLADRIDAMLGPGFDDLQAVEALFAEIESSGFNHPGVRILDAKRTRLQLAAAQQLEESESDEADDEEEDTFDAFAPLPSPASPGRSSLGPGSSARRGSVALGVLPGRRRGSIMLPPALGARRGSIMLPPGSTRLRRGSVMLPPGGQTPTSVIGASVIGPATDELGSPDTVQVAGPAGRRASVAIQVESLEALFKEDTAGELRSEWRHVFTLALPLVLSNLADEMSNIGLVAL